MRNKEWNKAWKEHVSSLCSLRWIPNSEDSLRIAEIQKELNEIIDRNTEHKKTILEMKQ